MVLDVYKELALLFKKNGFDLFLVGGSVRDYLLKGSFDDCDLATNASIDDIKEFLKVKCIYKLMGSGKFIFNDKVFDITSMRKENEYADYRHPSILERVNNPKDEFMRRDFTINALYMDVDGNIFDYANGLSDLKNKIIRCIGDPNVRIKEDPLRIVRALRFAADLDFNIEKKLNEAIFKNKELLINIKNVKINEELKKVKNKEKMNLLINEYGINNVVPLKTIASFEKNLNYILYKNNFIDLLNDIINNNSFINIIKINDENELINLKKNIFLYNNYVESTLDYEKITKMFGNKYIILIEVSKTELIKNNNDIAYIINKNNIESKINNNNNIFFYDHLILKDEKYYNIKNKKKRDKMYYDYFINLLKE